MPWVLGAPDPLTWAEARDKVRGDLWRPGTQGVPDDNVNRALHAAILDIEAEQRFLWLENILSTLEMLTADAKVVLPASIGVMHSISVLGSSGANPFRLARAQLVTVRELAVNSPGLPTMYALTDGEIHFDSLVPAGTLFEVIFDATTPDRLEDAVDSPSITLIRHQQAVIAGAKKYIALEYLHDDAKAARAQTAFQSHIDRLIDQDNAKRAELGGGTIVPDDALFIAAHGANRR